MCVMLPGRVIAVSELRADVEMNDGQRTVVNCIHFPDLAVGQYVLVDRGLVVEVIEAAEAEAIMSMYADIEQMLEAAGSALAEPQEAAHD